MTCFPRMPRDYNEDEDPAARRRKKKRSASSYLLFRGSTSVSGFHTWCQPKCPDMIRCRNANQTVDSLSAATFRFLLTHTPAAHQSYLNTTCDLLIVFIVDPMTSFTSEHLSFSYYAKLRQQEMERERELAEKYRDRARERRDGVNKDYEETELISTTANYRAVGPTAEA